jgi:hypothetical protein
MTKQPLAIVIPGDSPMERLRAMEGEIQHHDSKGLTLRWESGKLLRELREQRYEKTLEEIAAELGVSQPELSFRIRFSESEDALITAGNNGWSWHEVHQNMAELVGRKRAVRKAVGKLVERFRLSCRQTRNDLRKTHARDLSEPDFRVLDEIQEEIARIYDELGGTQ